mmetsp:Transcript_11017/g.1708  ORF Transcript_11017/g.1708 Transcript_11017/m.1708 type:complete len:112 (+) Transcript_11017:205-540(+)
MSFDPDKSSFSDIFDELRDNHIDELSPSHEDRMRSKIRTKNLCLYKYNHPNSELIRLANSVSDGTISNKLMRINRMRNKSRGNETNSRKYKCKLIKKYQDEIKYLKLEDDS